MDAGPLDRLPGARLPGRQRAGPRHAGAAAPGITDIVPYWRPPAWAAAVVVVDALAWGGADDDLVTRWSDLPEWPQMMLRALLFRLAVHALHPRSSAGALAGLSRVVDIVRLMV